jgi:hypothetical protein
VGDRQKVHLKALRDSNKGKSMWVRANRDASALAPVLPH